MNLEGKILIGKKRPSTLQVVPEGEALKIELLPAFKSSDIEFLKAFKLDQSSIEFSLEKPWSAVLVHDVVNNLRDFHFTNVAFPSLSDQTEGSFGLLLEALKGLKTRGIELADLKLTSQQQADLMKSINCENLHLDNVPVQAAVLQSLPKLHRLTITKALQYDAPGPQKLQVKQLVLIQQKADAKMIRALERLFDFDKIQYLGLDDCKLCDELFGQVTEYLGPNVTRLSLKNNYLTDRSVEILVNNC